MQDLNEIYIFTKVASAGSFTKAARLLGLPKSTVSSKVSQLEKRLGVTLIHRTTRRLHLTDSGDAYFRECVQAFDQIHSAESAASTAQSTPRGVLKLTAPVEFGASLLPEILDAFLKKHPEVELDLLITDRLVDLVAEGIDLGIRAGELEDSTMIAKKVGVSAFIPVASPAYLRRNGTPNHPRDLVKHECLAFSADIDRSTWELVRASTRDSSGGTDKVKVKISGRVTANHLSTLRAMALAGYGIALMTPFTCQAELKKGRLVRILPNWVSEADPVYLIYPSHRFVSSKVRAFVDFAGEALKNSLRPNRL